MQSTNHTDIVTTARITQARKCATQLKANNNNIINHLFSTLIGAACGFLAASGMGLLSGATTGTAAVANNATANHAVKIIVSAIAGAMYGTLVQNNLIAHATFTTVAAAAKQNFKTMPNL